MAFGTTERTEAPSKPEMEEREEHAFWNDLLPTSCSVQGKGLHLYRTVFVAEMTRPLVPWLYIYITLHVYPCSSYMQSHI